MAELYEENGTRVASTTNKNGRMIDIHGMDKWKQFSHSLILKSLLRSVRLSNQTLGPALNGRKVRMNCVFFFFFYYLSSEG